MIHRSTRARRAICAAALVAAVGGARATDGGERTCFSTERSREEIARRGLGEPFAAMRAAAADMEGEAVGARLCQSGATYFYEVRVLRRDGRLVTKTLDARGGGRLERTDR